MSVDRKNEKAIAEQIKQFSMSIAAISTYDVSGGLLFNTPIILGGEKLVEDLSLLSLVEQGFGQLNIVDLFLGKDYILKTASYFAEPLYQFEHLIPNLYLVKTNYRDAYLLGLLITPYSDINIVEYLKESSFIIKSYFGTFRRSTSQYEAGQIDDPTRRMECYDTARTLMSLLHYRVFDIRRLRGGSEIPGRQSYFTAVMILDAKVYHSDFICLQCGSVYDSEPENSKCSSCGGQVVKAPPVFEFENISFIFPDVLADRSEVKMTPLDYLTLYVQSEIPPSVKLAVHRINPFIFSNILYIPRRVIFEYKGTNDVIDLFSLWNSENNKFRLFIAISDSRFKDFDLMPYMAERVFLRDLSEGLNKKLSIEEIVKKSVIKDWNIIPPISLSEIDSNEKYHTWAGLRDVVKE